MKREALQHSMNRRSHVHDYRRPGLYHITLKAAEGAPFGTLQGTPDGGAHVDLTPQALRQFLQRECHPTQVPPARLDSLEARLLTSTATPSAEPTDAVGGRRTVLCDRQLLLLASPWHYQYRRKDDPADVATCKSLNCVVQALCHMKDDWWKGGR